MAAELEGYDMLEQILIRSDVEDVIRCKSICKSWHSLISTPYFVESHLKHARNNINNNKRIILESYRWQTEGDLLTYNSFFIVGSSNGLVCISPKDFQLLIVNPCTRETMEILQPPPEPLYASNHRSGLVWGFGYDSSNNDYKIVVGLATSLERRSTRFYVFSLKTCLWKFIKEIDYILTNWNSVSGILYDGALHWYITNSQSKKVIISFNLFREEFTEIQQPNLVDHPSFGSDKAYNLGVIEGCLCIYDSYYDSPPTDIWVLRSNNSGKQSWVELPHNCEMSDDVAYHMNEDDYSYDHTPHLSNSGQYIGAPIFVPSLVSPYVNMDSSSNSGSNM